MIRLRLVNSSVLCAFHVLTAACSKEESRKAPPAGASALTAPSSPGATDPSASAAPTQSAG